MKGELCGRKFGGSVDLGDGSSRAIGCGCAGVWVKSVYPSVWVAHREQQIDSPCQKRTLWTKKSEVVQCQSNVWARGLTDVLCERFLYGGGGLVLPCTLLFSVNMSRESVCRHQGSWTWCCASGAWGFCM